MKQLEEEMSVPELMHTINALRMKDYENKKFAAALKGIDLDENTESDPIALARKANNAKKYGENISPDDVLANPEFAINSTNGIGHEVI
jgi:hypothetical protein